MLITVKEKHYSGNKKLTQMETAESRLCDTAQCIRSKRRSVWGGLVGGGSSVPLPNYVTGQQTLRDHGERGISVS